MERSFLLLFSFLLRPLYFGEGGRTGERNLIRDFQSRTTDPPSLPLSDSNPLSLLSRHSYLPPIFYIGENEKFPC